MNTDGLDGEWLERQAERAEANLRAMPQSLIGPAARRLLAAIDAKQLPDNVISMAEARKRLRGN